MMKRKSSLSVALLATAAITFTATTSRAAYAPGCTVALTIPASVAHEFRGVAIQPDGKIVAVGYVQWTAAVGSRDFLIARFHPDLTLDTSFNGIGYRTEAFPWLLDEEAYAVAIHADLKIVVAGYTDTGSNQRTMGLVGYNPDGTIDAGFPIVGILITNNKPHEARALAIQPDGKILVAGFMTTNAGGGTRRVWVERLVKDWSALADPFDPTWTGLGRPIITGSNADEATGVYVDTRERVIVSVDATFAATGNDFVAVQLTPTGSLDTGFAGGAGFRAVDFTGNSTDTPTGVIRGPMDSIIIGGTSNGDVAIARFLPNGNLDAVLNDGTGPGRAIHDQGATEVGSALALDVGGNIVVAGQTDVNVLGSGVDLGVVQFDPTGATVLPNTFRNDLSNVAIGGDWAYGLAIMPDGKRLVAGTSTDITGTVATLALFNPDGTQDCGVVVQPVPVFTAASSGDAVSGQVMLNWLNPSYGPYTETIIVRNPLACPVNPTDGFQFASFVGAAGQSDGFVDTGLTLGTTYSYAAFVNDGVFGLSTRVCATATPFDRTAVNTEWIYGTGIAAMATPGIRIDFPTTSAAYTVANDGVVHSMTGGPITLGGGSWPAGWKPFRIGGPSQGFPIVLPLPPSGQRALLVSSEDGRVYALDAVTGDLIWRSAKLGPMLVNTPMAVLIAYSGSKDYIFVGTRNAAQPNRFYALNAHDGTVAWFFDNGGPPNDIGMIVSAAAMNYVSNQVYFTSFKGGATETVWCLNYSVTPPTPCWVNPGAVTPAGGNVGTSPIPYNGDVYVSEDVSGDLYGVNEVTGAVNTIFTLGDAGAIGYVFPRRGLDTVFASTINNVFSIDTIGGVENWPAVTSITFPSTPLHVPGTDDVYVGSGTGELFHLSATTGPPLTFEPIGGAGTRVGTPTFDIIRLMIYVGTGDGEVYAVRTPF